MLRPHQAVGITTRADESSDDVNDRQMCLRYRRRSSLARVHIRLACMLAALDKWLGAPIVRPDGQDLSSAHTAAAEMATGWADLTCRGETGDSPVARERRQARDVGFQQARPELQQRWHDSLEHLTTSAHAARLGGHRYCSTDAADGYSIAPRTSGLTAPQQHSRSISLGLIC